MEEIYLGDLAEIGSPVYLNRAITTVVFQLNASGLCVVRLLNGTENSDHTFEHLFALFQVEHRFFRIEGYVNLYLA